MILTQLEASERPWVVIVGAVIAIACGLFGAMSGALAHVSSIVLFLFTDPARVPACMDDVWSAAAAGAVAGVAAGVSWTCLYVSALLHLRRRSGELPSIPLSAGNATVHSLLAAVMFTLLFLAWSLPRHTAFGFLTVLTLIVALSVKWLVVGLVGGAAIRLVMKPKKK